MKKKHYVVLRQLPGSQQVIHKLFIFDVDKLKEEGFDFPYMYIADVIEKDIYKFINTFKEFDKAKFLVEELVSDQVVTYN